MLKLKGFSLIEIMTTITILGIVAVIAMPEYWKLRSRDEYRSEGQQLFDTILDARNAALTNKLCSNDSTAVRWIVTVNATTSPLSYQLACYYDDTNWVPEGSVAQMPRSELEILDFEEGNAPAAMDGSGGNPFPEFVFLSFFAGGVNGRLEYGPSGGPIAKGDKVQMIFGHIESDFQHTICFNRISGFPTFNKNGTTCQNY